MSKRERLISEMRAKQDGRCFYCGCIEAAAWHVDHKIPRSKGGTDLADNLVLACAPCNLRKSANDYDWFITQDFACMSNPALRDEIAEAFGRRQSKSATKQGTPTGGKGCATCRALVEELAASRASTSHNYEHAVWRMEEAEKRWHRAEFELRKKIADLRHELRASLRIGFLEGSDDVL